MTRALQRKFVVTAMVAVTVLLAVLLGVLNGVNAYTSSQQSGRLLEVLLRTETLPAQGEFPDGGPEGGEPNGPPPTREDGETPPEPGERGELEELMDRRGFLSESLTENDTRAAIYFVAVFSGEGSCADVSRTASVDEDGALAIATPLYNSGTREGSYGSYRFRCTESAAGETVYVFLDTSSQSASVFRVGLLSLLLGALAWALMLLLVILLSKRAIRPIAENIEKQRSFVTDAGHEIKTPLAIIQANTEAMELCGGETKYTRNIRAQVVRLNGLMQELLTLARAENVGVRVQTEELELAALVRETVQSFAPSMELRGLTAALELPAELRLHGNRELLIRLTSILTDNAVKYAVADSTVRVFLRQRDRVAELRVENRCDALPDCPPDKLFDRFYRADEARTQRAGGYGIGLSAAQAICRAHRGSIEAAYGAENTITFTAKLPMK